MCFVFLCKMCVFLNKFIWFCTLESIYHLDCRTKYAVCTGEPIIAYDTFHTLYKLYWIFIQSYATTTERISSKWNLFTFCFRMKEWNNVQHSDFIGCVLIKVTKYWQMTSKEDIGLKRGSQYWILKIHDITLQVSGIHYFVWTKTDRNWNLSPLAKILNN